jgi:hypothetical protein
MRRLVLALATLCVVRGAARADDSSLHLLGSAQLGFTDNLLSGPRNPPPGIAAPPVEWDLFLGLRPGVLLTYGTPRATHEATYSLDAILYTRHPELSSLFQRAGWKGFFLLSPRSELLTSVDGSFGNGNLFPTTVPSSGQVGPAVSGNIEMLGGAAGEDYQYTASPDVRLQQAGYVRYNRISGGGVTTGSEAGMRLALDKAFRYDALTLLAGASYVSLTQPVAGSTTGSTTDLVNARGSAMYRRDLNKDITSVVEVGAVDVLPVNGIAAPSSVFAVGGVQLAYIPAWGTATFGVRRDVSPNLLIAENTLADTAAIGAWLPLPWLRDDPQNPKLTFQSTLGVSRTRIISSTTGQTVEGFDDVLADIAVNWQLRKNAELSFRYQLVWQSSDLSAMTPLPVFGFVRDTVLVQFVGRWPERLAVEVPVRQTLRVDRSNITPVGDEAGGGGAADTPGGK